MTTRFYQLTASAFDWNIAEGKTIKAWGFDNTFPGPILKAKKGDTLVIQVKNELPEPTMIHWHGIRLPSVMDGTDDVQRPIQPGEEFEYRFTVPDAGTFWYHSHFNETVQMERGMYGALIVEDDSDPVFDAEKVLVIDDVKLNANNEFKNGNVIQRWIERHDGRQGKTILINGKEKPEIEINAGQTERWRFINASSARYIRLSMGGKEFKIIGTDGGLIEKPIEVNEVLMIPGERMDIIAGPFKEGENFLIETLPYNRTTVVKTKRQELATVTIGKAKPSIASIPDELRKIETLAAKDAEVNRKITFEVDMNFKHGVDFLVNGNMHDMDKPVYVDELQVWEIENTSLMDHPYHLHGFFFQVLEENGKEPLYKAWKDSYNLKPRSNVKIAWIPDNRPGEWMYHCHILEHHAAGMMSHFEVVDPAVGSKSSGHNHSHAHHHHH